VWALLLKHEGTYKRRREAHPPSPFSSFSRERERASPSSSLFLCCGVVR